MAWLLNMQFGSGPIPSSPHKTKYRRSNHLICSAMRDYRPPEGYSHQQQLRASSIELVQERYPELLDLVIKGDLIVISRDPRYQERRTDGYQEPEEVFVLGTAHLSRKSAEDVRRLVAAVQPQSVVVELCRSRSALMYPQGPAASSLSGGGAVGSGSNGDGGGSTGSQAAASTGGDPLGMQREQQQQGKEGGPSTGGAFNNSTASGEGSGPPGAAGLGQAPTGPSSHNLLGLSGPGLLPAFQRTLQLGGRSALLLRLLLGTLTSRLGAQGSHEAGGRMLGAEFVAAREAAEETGALIVLGDRPIEITLRRAWQVLSWRRRLQLAGQLVQGALSQQQVLLDEESIEKLKEDDAVSLVFSQLGAEFPEVMGPLVFERDTYLAWSLKRSKAVNGAKRVVGVVGKGHLRGVCYALTLNSSALRFKDLVGQGEGSGSARRRGGEVLRQAVVETAVVGALLWAWGSWQAP